LGGELPKGSLNGRSLKGGSCNLDPLGGSSHDPHVGFYGWSTYNPRIFMPPWYQLVPV
jgi:hypothetical protein